MNNRSSLIKLDPSVSSKKKNQIGSMYLKLHSKNIYLNDIEVYCHVTVLVGDDKFGSKTTINL